MFLSSIILPLYIYPSGDTPSTGTWGPLFTAISANPSVNFTVIVNPASGPGKTAYPDSNYIANVAQLNSQPTVTTLGYVHTNYTNRKISYVQSDVKVYAAWANYTKADIHVDGIFLDEAPATGSSANLNYMSQAATAVRNYLPSGRSIIMTNPGVQVDQRFYSYADFINVFENTYAAYTNSSVAATPAAFANKAVFMIHTFTGNTAMQRKVVNDTQQGNIGGLLITTANDYDAFSGMWTSFCAQEGGAAS